MATEFSLSLQCGVTVEGMTYNLLVSFVYRGTDKSLARPGRKQGNFLSEWREFPSAPCLKKNI